LFGGKSPINFRRAGEEWVRPKVLGAAGVRIVAISCNGSSWLLLVLVLVLVLLGLLLRSRLQTERPSKQAR